MSWLSKNKFLAGFGAAMLLGVGGLGYLTYSAMDRSSSAESDFEGALAKLKGLQDGHPYPEKGNREKLVAQKDALNEKIASFQKQLADSVLPVEPLTPTDFQDKLKETVARVTAKAGGDAHLKLPDKFYMGFPEYSSKPPEKAAAALLGRELVAFESIINLMLAAKDVELKEFSREELKEEKDNEKPKPGAKKSAQTERKLVQHSGFTVKFESSDAAFRTILNGIVGNKEQFYIVRRIKVNSTMTQAPQKANSPAPNTPSTNPSTPAPGPAVPPPQAPSQRLEYIFGTERVDVALEIEMVDFAKPEAPVKSVKKEKEDK